MARHHDGLPRRLWRRHPAGSAAPSPGCNRSHGKAGQGARRTALQ